MGCSNSFKTADQVLCTTKIEIKTLENISLEILSSVNYTPSPKTKVGTMLHIERVFSINSDPTHVNDAKHSQTIVSSFPGKMLDNASRSLPVDEDSPLLLKCHEEVLAEYEENIFFDQGSPRKKVRFESEVLKASPQSHSKPRISALKLKNYEFISSGVSKDLELLEESTSAKVLRTNSSWLSTLKYDKLNKCNTNHFEKVRVLEIKEEKIKNGLSS